MTVDVSVLSGSPRVCAYAVLVYLCSLRNFSITFREDYVKSAIVALDINKCLKAMIEPTVTSLSWTVNADFESDQCLRGPDCVYMHVRTAYCYFPIRGRSGVSQLRCHDIIPEEQQRKAEYIMSYFNKQVDQVVSTAVLRVINTESPGLTSTYLRTQ